MQRLLICFFLAQAACQPMEYGDFTSSKGFAEGDNALFSPDIDEYEDLFLSDKLDLVFVTDSHPDMAIFYRKQLFGQGFLSRFEDYDWRFAYTNMSVDPDTTEKLTQEGDEEEGECQFFSSLLSTVFGVFAEGLRTTARGLKGLGQCVSSIWPDFSTEEFADGRFLPFEHEGKKWEPEGGNCLTKSVENYDRIFEDSFQLNNNKDNAHSRYDAPELTEEDQKSHPLQALLLSLVEGSADIEKPKQDENSGQTAKSAQEASSMTKRAGALESEQDKNTIPAVQNSEAVLERAEGGGNENSALETCRPFFRPDSVIVYVLITVNDITSDTLLQKFQQNLDSSLDSFQRLKLIPVSIGPRSSLLCGLPTETRFSTTPKIRQLAQKTGSSALDLCSKNLPDKLFEEITKSLSPTKQLTLRRLEHH